MGTATSGRGAGLGEHPGAGECAAPWEAGNNPGVRVQVTVRISHQARAWFSGPWHPGNGHGQGGFGLSGCFAEVDVEAEGLEPLVVTVNNRAYDNDWEHQVRMARQRSMEIDGPHPTSPLWRRAFPGTPRGR